MNEKNSAAIDMDANEENLSSHMSMALENWAQLKIAHVMLCYQKLATFRAACSASDMYLSLWHHIKESSGSSFHNWKK